MVYPGGGTGRHAGLKILFAVMQVTVQLRSRVLSLSRLVEVFYFMYFVYILYSKAYDRYYIGHCEDLTLRLTRHNNKGVPSTKFYVPWEVVYTETFISRTFASAREREIKSKKSKKYIEFLLSAK